MSHNILQEDVVRKALPDPVIPAWLNPRTVDVDNPLKLPLCWYGLPFFSEELLHGAESADTASSARQCGSAQPLAASTGA